MLSDGRLFRFEFVEQLAYADIKPYNQILIVIFCCFYRFAHFPSRKSTFCKEFSKFSALDFCFITSRIANYVFVKS